MDPNRENAISHKVRAQKKSPGSSPGCSLVREACAREALAAQRFRESIRLTVLVALREIVNLRVGCVLADAIRFLDLARQLIALAGDRVDVVVGELAPLLFYLAFKLLPVSFNRVPVHCDLLVSIAIAFEPVSPLKTYQCNRDRHRGRYAGTHTRRRIADINLTIYTEMLI